VTFGTNRYALSTTLCLRYLSKSSHTDSENLIRVDYFVKVDGDVIGGTSNESLDRFLDGSDMVVFERYFTSEICAGFYAIRNTELGRIIVSNWSEYFWRDAHMGYNGGDNGSIHFAILDTLGLPGSEECWNIFRNELNGTLNSYFRFVACAREVMGAPRKMLMDPNTSDLSLDGSITIWPAMYGPMADWMFTSNGYRKAHPFHHGIKNHEDANITERYGPSIHWGDLEANNGSCVSSTEMVGRVQPFDTDEWNKFYMPLVKSYHTPKTGDYECSFNNRSAIYHWQVPRWSVCNGAYEKCRPLAPDDPALTPTYCVLSTDKSDSNEVKSRMPKLKSRDHF